MSIPTPDIEHINHKAFSLVSKAADALGFDCYAVGGYVRDLFLSRPSTDIDFVSVGQGSGIKIATEVARLAGRKAGISIFNTYGTAQVKIGNTELEFVGARRESYRRDSRNPIVEEGTLTDDLSRRDFTINALAMQVNGNNYGQIIDMFHGIDDLKAKIIRTPLDADVTFSDDPLRMLRAIRFATQLNFTIHPDTLLAIGRNAYRISIITPERISTELNKIMHSPQPSIGWKLLLNTGLLQLIIPEIHNLSGVEIIHGRGHKDNFEHTMLVLDRVSENSQNIWLRWAALLHDIAKPVTKRWDDNVGWTFHNHNFVGAKMVATIFRRLKMPLGQPMQYVKKFVELHMRPIALVEETVTDSAIRRLVTDAEGDLGDLMILCRADITSRNPEKVKRHLHNFNTLLEKIDDVATRDHLRNFQPPIDGAEIMQTFGLSPCATVGQIKSAIKDAILDGIIPNEYQPARDFMLRLGNELNLTPIIK